MIGYQGEIFITQLNSNPLLVNFNLSFSNCNQRFLKKKKTKEPPNTNTG
jgi:hypothetical protein